MKEIENLDPRPFTRFCMSIGAVPSSYLAGMTIEQQLLWFCSYLEKEVIPAVNNNAEAVEELQQLFTELHNYVEHYFDNLDVQEEINNKLDEMVESGELQELLTQQYTELRTEVTGQINALDNEMDSKITALNNSLTSSINSVNSSLTTQIQDVAEEQDTLRINVTSRINEIDTKVENATSGSPLVASSTAGMTNTDRVYVNTTDGNWYYYDGDSWEIGGVYQSSGIADGSIDIAKLDSNFSRLEFSAKKFSDAGLYHYGANIRLTQPLLMKKGTVITFGASYLTNYYYRIMKNADLFGAHNLTNVTSYINTPNTYTIPETGFYTIGSRLGASETTVVDEAPLTDDDIDLTYYVKNYITKFGEYSYTNMADLISSCSYAKWNYTRHTLDRATTDIMMSRAYKFDNDVIIRLKNSDVYRYILIYMSAPAMINDNVIHDTGWKTSEELLVPKNTYFSIRFNKQLGGNITLNEFLENIKIYSVDNNVNLLQDQIDDINNELNLLKVPSYWESSLDSKIEDINELELANDFDGDSFIFITDTHWQSNAKKSPSLVQKILNKTNIKNVTFGGDVLNLDSTQAAAIGYYKSFYTAFKNTHLHSVLGNHDFNDNVPATYPEAHLTQQQVYSLAFKKEENEVLDIVKPQNNTNPVKDSFYYCIDNKVQKIRYIYLNSRQESYGSTQLAWLLDRLEELDNTWTVILFTHFVWTNIVDNTPVINASYTELLGFLTSNQGSYNCTIAGLLSGHTHFDYSTTSTLGFPVIATSTDCYSLSTTALSPEMTLGTDTEQCFDVVTIDKTNKKLYFTRIGAGNDREFSYT